MQIIDLFFFCFNMNHPTIIWRKDTIITRAEAIVYIIKKDENVTGCCGGDGIESHRAGGCGRCERRFRLW